jgi:hypothetical protein
VAFLLPQKGLRRKMEPNIYKEGNVLRCGSVFVIVTYETNDDHDATFVGTILTAEYYPAAGASDSFDKDGSWSLSSLQEAANVDIENKTVFYCPDRAEG